MKNTYFFLLVFLLITCGGNKEEQFVITTEYGDMEIILYEETPQHRKNFIELTKKKFYQDLLFHRVINHFMIQSGDPNSKNASISQQLGDGGPDYQIDPEFSPIFFHRKGAIGAARTGDDKNSQKKSSGSQFYIIQGKRYTDKELDEIAMERNKEILTEIVNELAVENREKIRLYRLAKNDTALDALFEDIKIESRTRLNKRGFRFTKQQRKVYKTIGGAPHLDGLYTVFGQVVDGLDVIDKIAAVETNENDRPLKDIKMSVKVN